MIRILVLLFVISPQIVKSQFAPAAGKPGSTAIKHDSSCFVSWANKCTIQRGYMNIALPDSGFAYVGDSSSATGIPLRYGVVSLGDGGSVMVEFPLPVMNGIGWDFAVFENTFLDSFLELAFVEVSTNGIDFVRFAAESTTDTGVQTGTFGFTKPENIHNLAGKYRSGFGTPFDLEELKDSTTIDINNIKYIRIIDVVGSIQNKYASRDSKGRKINDPWPTMFPSSGFDLDAVGVINQNISLGKKNKYYSTQFAIWPNPIVNSAFNVFSNTKTQLTLLQLTGQKICTFDVQKGQNTLDFTFATGIYFLQDSNTGYTMQLVKL